MEEIVMRPLTFQYFRVLVAAIVGVNLSYSNIASDSKLLKQSLLLILYNITMNYLRLR